MTIGDVLLYTFLFGMTFFAGRLSMMHTIVKAVINDQESNDPSEPGQLKIEKIGSVYYAYVNSAFAGQATNFEDLFVGMSKSKQFSEWKIAELPKELSAEEHELMLKAIEKHFVAK